MQSAVLNDSDLAPAELRSCLGGSRTASKRDARTALVWCLAFALIAGTEVIGEDSTGGKSASARETLIKITSQKKGLITDLIVENVQAAEVTVTFEMDLVNLAADVAFPIPHPSRQSEKEVFTLSPIDQNGDGVGHTRTIPRSAAPWSTTMILRLCAANHQAEHTG